MKCLWCVVVAVFGVQAYASDFIPINEQDSSLYYKIGGGDSYGFPPVSSTQAMTLDAGKI